MLRLIQFTLLRGVGGGGVLELTDTMVYCALHQQLTVSPYKLHDHLLAFQSLEMAAL